MSDASPSPSVTTVLAGRNPVDMLHSLLMYLAAATGLRYLTADGYGRELWLTNVKETQAAPVHTIASTYGGAGVDDQLRRLSVQWETKGQDELQAFRVSAAIDAVLREASGALDRGPLKVDGYLSPSINPQRDGSDVDELGGWWVGVEFLSSFGLVRRDEDNRAVYVFNTELEFRRPLTAAEEE